MKKIAIILFSALALLCSNSCDKPYETTIDLAVDYSDEYGGLKFKNAKTGYSYILVTSNSSWTAKVTEEKWCGFIPKDQVSLYDNRTHTVSGSGTQYLKFSVNENYSPAPRTVKFTVTGSGKTIEFTIFQPGATDDE